MNHESPRIHRTVHAKRPLSSVACATLVGLTGCGTISPPPSAALKPGPTRAFVGYAPDGAYHVADGAIANPTLRPRVLNAIPRLAQYGFKRYVSTLYAGAAKSEQVAAELFGPITAAARANGMKFVPGMWLHHIVDNLYGTPDSPPWNVKGPDFDLRHPKNPAAVGEQRFWDELVVRATNLARGAQSDQVYIDCEYVLYKNRMDPFFSDAQLASIRAMIRGAVQSLRNNGVFLVLYHPAPHATDPAENRMAVGLLRPDDANDPLAQVELFDPAPYFDNPPFGTVAPEQSDATVMANGFFVIQACYGFTNANNPFGFTAARYDEYCRTRPGVAERSWFFVGPDLIAEYAAAFEKLAR